MDNRKQFKKIKNLKGEGKDRSSQGHSQKKCFALINPLLVNILFNNWAPPGLPSWKNGKGQCSKRILIKGSSISASSHSKWTIESNLKDKELKGKRKRYDLIPKKNNPQKNKITFFNHSPFQNGVSLE